MYCQTCKRESFVLSGTGKKGTIAKCGGCGNRFDQVYFDIAKELRFIADEDLTKAERNILRILKDAGFEMV